MEKKKRIRITTTKSKNHPNPQGRPESYNDGVAALILKGLLSGKTLTKTLKSNKKLPSLVTVMNWLNKKHPNFKEDFFIAYYEARKIQAEIIADETVDISDEKWKDAQRQALRVKTRHWLAGKINPKFSDKMQLTGAEGKNLIPSAPTKVVFNFVKSKEDDNE